MKMNFFELRGNLPKKISLAISILGVIISLIIWQLVTVIWEMPRSILPSPIAVLSSFHQLHFEDALVLNTFYSIKLNLLGYIEAVLISLPLGFIIGLFPIAKALVSKYIQALRFLPLAAMTGLFIIWFGIDDNMKVQFLATSIIVYLLPVVIKRVEEVEIVYEQTAFTLSANKLQMILTVYIPSVLSKIIDDIRVLVAISWTYITIAELLNMNGGIGALIYKSARQSRTDKIFAILIVIVLIGFIQDKLFKLLDKKICPHKYC